MTTIPILNTLIVPIPLHTPPEYGIVFPKQSREADDINVMRSLIQVDGCTVDHVYLIHDAMYVLKFLNKLLLWTTEIVTAEKNKQMVDRAMKYFSSERESEDEFDENIEIVSEVSIINSLTIMTLAVRQIRHEYMIARNSALFDPERLVALTASISADIVTALDSVGWTGEKENYTPPPLSILTRFGFSERVCRLANIQLLYHTPGVHPDQLFKGGMDIRRAKIGSFGTGLYFSDDPYKAMAYFQPEWGVTSDRHHPDYRYLTTSLVILGRMKKYPVGYSDPSLFRVPINFDSVMGVPHDRNEIVVYDSSSVIMSHVIYYKITTPPPQPGSKTGGALLVPVPLHQFFTEIIDRGKSQGVDPDVRHCISDLLKGVITATKFVGIIRDILAITDPPPPTLILNLENHLLKIKNS